ncbi:MAG: AAA family ATPase [Bacteroidales bacterium]|nr:AAA family ATPase [Bacteroidales bacterium]
MVKVVGKMDLDSDSEKKLNAFRNRIIEIMTKNNKTTLPLGKVLHECETAKADIKKKFKKYYIPKNERSNDNDNFNWQNFFDENLYPEFEVEPNHSWGANSASDALTYKPQKEANTIGNNAIIQTTKKKDSEKNEPKSPDINKPTTSEIIEEHIVANKVETEKPEIKMTQEEINKLLNKLLDELNTGLYEKERSIRLTLLAILAGESTFMLGEPGTAKSLVARRISEAFENSKNDGEIKFFDYLMNQFSTPEEIFGPISIQELKNDKYIRKTENYLPKAQFAFLDEIWKANPAIQNALLTILNEKIFRNGVQVEKVPLIGFMSASNELPEKGKGLEAIFDRFLVRILEKPISDNDNFRKMISAERKMDTTISQKLSKAIIQTILEESEGVTISDECLDIIDAIRKSLTKRNTEIQDDDEKYLVSDRRWKKIANLIRVSAYCNNRIETDIMDATLIADCIWNTEKQEEEAKQIVTDALKAYGVKCKSNVKDLKQTVDQFKSQVEDNFYESITIEGGYKEKHIGSVDYYEVQNQSDKSDVCYFSQQSFQSNSLRGYDRYGRYVYKNVYYKNKLGNEIEADFDDVSMTYTLTNGAKYKVIEEPKQTSLQRRNLPEQTKNAAVNLFNGLYSDIRKQIHNAIKSIDNDYNDLKSQFSSNLFSDSDRYSDILFKEQINAKTELSKLTTELNNQRKRYQ